jgi:hypothetical protein
LRLKEIPMQTTARFDIYAFIHKGLRACFAHTLVAVGRLDWTDSDEVAFVLGEVDDLLAFCRSHLAKENRFVHTAMESRRPGSTLQGGQDHVHHEQDIATLTALCESLRRLPALRRENAARDLYRELARFVAENLEHMAMEEREHNRVLWETHSDDEIRAIEGAIVASLTPEDSRLSLGWMVRAMSAGERAGFLGAIRQSAPAEAFNGMLQMTRSLLEARDRQKLDAALGIRTVPADFTGVV